MSVWGFRDWMKSSGTLYDPGGYTDMTPMYPLRVQRHMVENLLPELESKLSRVSARRTSEFPGQEPSKREARWARGVACLLKCRDRIAGMTEEEELRQARISRQQAREFYGQEGGHE